MWYTFSAYKYSRKSLKVHKRIILYIWTKHRIFKLGKLSVNYVAETWVDGTHKTRY